MQKALFFVHLPLGYESLWLDPLELCGSLCWLAQGPAEYVKAGHMGHISDIKKEEYACFVE